MANHFAKHHAASKKAFDQGDHKTAMHHIGHMMMATRSAMKGASAPTGAPEGPDATQAMNAAQAGSDDDLSQSQPPDGISTPAPMPAKGGFFGQFAKSGPKPTPSAAPHRAGPASPLGATNHTPSGGFNRARFGAAK